MLQAQMTVVREKAEKSFNDFQGVVRKMEEVAMRRDVEPLADAAGHLRVDVDRLSAEMLTKADEESVRTSPLLSLRSLLPPRPTQPLAQPAHSQPAHSLPAHSPPPPLTRRPLPQVSTRVEDLQDVADEHRTLLATKADESVVRERHDGYANDTAKTLTSLREATEHLGISINSVEEQVGQVAHIAASKAEKAEVDDVLRMNESVQEQVSDSNY